MAYERIRALREDNDMTQTEVGNAIHTSQRAYAYYESGQRVIPPGVLIALSRLYNVSIDYLLGESNDARRHP